LPEREEDEAKDAGRSAVKESHQRRRLRSPEDFEYLNLNFEKKLMRENGAFLARNIGSNS
jgi:hypothetical protein